MSVKFYPKSHFDDETNGYTAEEVKRGIHWLYADVICDSCGKDHHVSEDGKPCHQCGKTLTIGGVGP